MADQGVDREPEPKLGPVATDMERAGRPSHAGDDWRGVKERNEERAGLGELLEQLVAELIYLDPDRPRGPAFTGDEPDDEKRSGDERDEPERERPSIGTTKGGMVHQQMEALDRFRENSASLEEQRRERLRLLDEAINNKPNPRDPPDGRNSGRDVET